MGIKFNKQFPVPGEGIHMPVPMVFEASFETGEQHIKKVFVPANIKIERVRAIVSKALAATDTGTVVVKNAAGTTMATLTAVASAALNTEYDSGVITTNNKISAGSFFTVTTAKTTAGGKVTLSIEYSVTR